MPHRIGKCTNYASCKLAYKNADIETEEDFVCPECGQPLRETAAPAAPAVAPKKALLYGGIGAGVLILGLIVFFVIKALLHHGDTAAPVADTGTPAPDLSTPAPPPISAPQPFTTPEPAATPKPRPVVTITPPKPDVTLPPPTTAASEDPVATAVIDSDPKSDENKTMRAEVLKRIDSIPNLKTAERRELYEGVNKAKAMMKVITIPFNIGQRALSPAVGEKLCEASHAPQLQKVIKDPAVVFVILGFADTIGTAENGLKLSTARAEAVTDSLRDRCKFTNRMQPVGMGSSEFFGTGKKDKNRVVEVWAVLP